MPQTVGISFSMDLGPYAHCGTKEGEECDEGQDGTGSAGFSECGVSAMYNWMLWMLDAGCWMLAGVGSGEEVSDRGLGCFALVPPTSGKVRSGKLALQ